MGVSRSASTVIAYAMKEYAWSLEKAYNFVKQKRSITRPNDSFMRQLAEYEGILDARYLLPLHRGSSGRVWWENRLAHTQPRYSIVYNTHVLISCICIHFLNWCCIENVCFIKIIVSHTAFRLQLNIIFFRKDGFVCVATKTI